MAITVEIFTTIQAAEKKPAEVLKGALSKLKLKKKSKKAKEKSRTSVKEQHKSQPDISTTEEAEQPSEVIVEVEDLHPLPEVSLGDQITEIIGKWNYFIWGLLYIVCLKNEG